MKSKVYLLLLLLLLIRITATGQDPIRGVLLPSQSKFNVNYDLKIENPYGLFKYEIPIYNFKNNFFDTNIFLEYTSNTFNPKTYQSPVGYNWRINYGPFIERELRGLPDELKESGSIRNPDKWKRPGFLYGARNLKDCFSKTKEGRAYYDFEPDIFHFYISDKYKGYFLFDKDGKVRVVAKGCVVDDSKFVYQNHDQLASVSSFTITTDDGYRYEFGTSYTALEVTEIIKLVKEKYDYTYDDYRSYISKWHITKITSNFGECMDYLYDESLYFEEVKYRGSMSTSKLYNTDCYCDEYNNSGVSQTRDPSISNDVNKLVGFPRIKSISSGSKSVQFSYITSFTETRFNYTLGSIYVVDGLKFIMFNFDYLKNGERYFLKSLEGPSKDKYSFNYCFPKFEKPELPSTSVSNVDNLGNWNGQYDEQMLDDKDKRTNLEIYAAGLLDKIVLPTGGYINIGYEANEVGAVFEFEDLKKKGISDKKVSGARVNSICVYDRRGALSGKKQYTYIKDYASTLEGKNSPRYSSGIAVSPSIDGYRVTKRYPIHNSHSCNRTVDIICSKQGWFDNNYYKLPKIVYSEVQEHDYKNSCINRKYETVENLSSVPYYDADGYYFLDFGSDPDEGIGAIISLDRDYDKCMGHCGLNIPFSFVGNMKEVGYYTSDSSLIKREIYEYNNSNIWNDRIEGCYYNSNVKRIYAVPTVPLLLKRKSTIEFFGKKDSIKTTDLYSYNTCNYLSKHSVNLGDGKVCNVKYTYVNELMDGVRKDPDFFRSGVRIDSLVKAYDAMVYKNIIGNPIEIIRTNEEDGGEILTGVDLNIYRLKESNPVLDRIMKMNLDLLKPKYEPISIKLESLSGSQPESFYSLNIDKSMYAHMLFNKYDARGNILELTDNYGIRTSFLWDYTGYNLIAKADNIEYNNLISAVGVVPADNKEEVMAPFLREFRSKMGKMNVNLFTYTYVPLFGVSTLTTPFGLVNKYIYDSKGRLVRIEENDRITTTYDYKYYNETDGLKYGNAAVSRVYRKNCLQPNLVGSSVTYEVPANKYISLISQRDADLKAFADTAKNGQNYADANGTCVEQSLDVVPENLDCFIGGQKGLLGTVEVSSSQCWDLSYEQMGVSPYVEVRTEGGSVVKGGCGKMRLYIHQIEPLRMIRPSAIVLKTKDGNFTRYIRIGDL